MLNLPIGLEVGIDEAGRGSLIGPVVAAAVIFKDNNIPDGINDSKKILPKKRKILYDKIIENHHVAIGIGTLEEVESLNVLEATKLAMIRAYNNLAVIPDIVLVDGNMLPNIEAEKYAIIKGDGASLTIAAASIIAKVSRDTMILEFAKKYPIYFWNKNSGYGTKHHLDAIKQFGVSEFHRKTFSPLKNYGY